MECYHTKLRNIRNLLKETNASTKHQLHIRDHPTWKKIHHQKRENGGGNSGNSQKLINYLRLQDWDVLGYAYALIIKRYFYKKSRAALKCTFWTIKWDVFQLDLNEKGLFSGDIISVLRWVGRPLLTSIYMCSCLLYNSCYITRTRALRRRKTCFSKTTPICFKTLRDILFKTAILNWLYDKIYNENWRVLQWRGIPHVCCINYLCLREILWLN